MKTLNKNAVEALEAFKQAKSWGWNISQCTDFATDELESESDINQFENEILGLL